MPMFCAEEVMNSLDDLMPAAGALLAAAGMVLALVIVWRTCLG